MNDVDESGESSPGQRFEGADFSGKDVRGVDFTSANLRSANFRDATFGVVVGVKWDPDQTLPLDAASDDTIAPRGEAP